MEVTNVISPTEYTVARNRAGTISYLGGNNPSWKKGATVVNYQKSGDGGVYMTASDTNAPYLSIFDHAGAPWTTTNTRLRIGNLNGYLGYSEDRYGIAIGEATKYLKYDPVDGLRIAGNIAASTIDIGTNAWHVDINGNMWWGASTTYAGGTIKISAAGAANLSSGVIAGWHIGPTTITSPDDPSGFNIVLNSATMSITFGGGVTIKNTAVPFSGLGGMSIEHDTGNLKFEISGNGEGMGSRQMVMATGDNLKYFGMFDDDAGGFTIEGNMNMIINGDITANNFSGTNTGDSSGHSGLAALSGATFSGSISAANLSGTNTGDSSGHSGLMPTSGGTFSGNVTMGTGIALVFGANAYIDNPKAIYMKPLTSAPGASAGCIYYNSLTGYFYGYDGSTWNVLG